MCHGYRRYSKPGTAHRRTPCDSARVRRQHYRLGASAPLLPSTDATLLRLYSDGRVLPTDVVRAWVILEVAGFDPGLCTAVFTGPERAAIVHFLRGEHAPSL